MKKQFLLATFLLSVFVLGSCGQKGNETLKPGDPDSGETDNPGGGETENPDNPDSGETDNPDNPGGGETENPDNPTEPVLIRRQAFLDFTIDPSTQHGKIGRYSDKSEYEEMFKNDFLSNEFIDLTKEVSIINIFGGNNNIPTKACPAIKFGARGSNGLLEFSLDKTKFEYIDKIDVEVYPHLKGSYDQASNTTSFTFEPSAVKIGLEGEAKPLAPVEAANFEALEPQTISFNKEECSKITDVFSITNELLPDSNSRLYLKTISFTFACNDIE